jgi:hypothetical protein
VSFYDSKTIIKKTRTKQQKDKNIVCLSEGLTAKEKRKQEQYIP